jgi:hypothetical protein
VLFTRLCAGMVLAVSIAGSAGAATLAGVEFSVTVPDRFAMNPNPFTIGSGGAQTVAGNGGLPATRASPSISPPAAGSTSPSAATATW